MLDILNKIDFDYKIVEKDVDNKYMQLDQYLKSFSGKKTPTKEEIHKKLQEIVGKNRPIIQQFNWLDIWSIDRKQIYTTSGEVSNEKLQSICKILTLLLLEKYCPERLTYAGIQPNQSDILVGSLFENPISGFSYLFERPRKIVYQNFNSAAAYWWWSYRANANFYSL